MAKKALCDENASQASGNTKPEAPNQKYSCPKKRAFLITFNENPLSNCQKCFDYFSNLKSLTYLISCKEYNKAGNIHCHMYVHFNNSYSIPQKLITETKMHIDVAFGSPKQNSDYVKKEGDRWKSKQYQKTTILNEFGTVPTQGSLSIAELKQIENSEDLPDYKLYNIWSKLKHEHTKTKIDSWHKSIDVYYIQGPSGIGKSTKALEIIKENGYTEFDEAKHVNNFWHNVDGNGACIYDDFRDKDMNPQEFIHFIDYNVHNLNIKGGSIRNNYNLIVITSIQPLSDIYSTYTEPKEQWLRRIHLIELS